MDKLTLPGLFIAFTAILVGQFLEGGSLASLFDLAALIIVVGGSAGAVMLQSHGKTFSKALSIFSWVLRPPSIPVEETIDRITDWGQVARRQGLLGLEKSIDPELPEFTRKGLNLLIDGSDAKAIREALYIDLDTNDEALLKAAKVYESMGGYSPTLGIVGAVLGLIHVMGNLAEPQLLGQGIATAFVATIYGVGLANLFYLPVYHKLRAVISAQSKYQEMIIEGLASIAEGENPRLIQGKLTGFVAR